MELGGRAPRLKGIGGGGDVGRGVHKFGLVKVGGLGWGECTVWGRVGRIKQWGGEVVC